MEAAKVVLITGSSRGIGRQLALDCARNGLAVAVNYVANAAAAQEVMDQIEASGGDALLVRADVGIGAEVTAMVTAVMQRFGRIDCVINNAGVGRIADLQAIDEAHFEQTLRTNLISAFLVSQAAIPHMVSQGGGRLIFMSSLAARTGGLVSAAYAASKAGAEGLMHYYATYLLRHRITANAIAPALIASDIVGEMDLPPPDKLPLGRLGRPEELWPAVRMLLETEYITGQTIQINAGRYMT
jgi:3-oxoacyl-[acyl-carrier protein] reductase